MFGNHNNDLMSQYSGRSDNDLMSKYSGESSGSSFDTRSQHHASHIIGGQSLFSSLNVRDDNMKHLSIVDRMRGIQASRLNFGDNASLDEQYNDSSLDKRVFGGAYNVTTSDIYKDKSLFKAHFNLFTDSFIGNGVESTQIDNVRSNYLTGNVDITDITDSTKDNFKSNNLSDTYITNKPINNLSDMYAKKEGEPQKNTSQNIGYQQQSYLNRKNVWDKKETQIVNNDDLTSDYMNKGDYVVQHKNTESIFLNKNEVIEDDNRSNKKETNNGQRVEQKSYLNSSNVWDKPHNEKDKQNNNGGGFLEELKGRSNKDNEDVKSSNNLNSNNVDRKKIKESLIIELKELRLDNDNKQDMSVDDIENGNIYKKMNYAEILKKDKFYRDKYDNSNSETEKLIYEKEIAIIKPILIKKALHDSF